MALLRGGRAGINSVTFETDEYISSAKRKGNQIITRKTKKTKKKTQTVIFIMLVLSSLVLERLFFYDLILKFGNQIFILVFFMFMLFTRFSSISRYHGAEHKVFNCLLENKKLYPDKVSEYSRVSKYCGTNTGVILITIYFLTYILTSNLILSVVLGLVISYSLISLNLKPLNVISVPFFYLGSLFQKYVFTQEPSSNEIEVAIAALSNLREE